MSVVKLEKKSGDNNIDGLIDGFAWANRRNKKPITYGFASSINDYADYFDKDMYGKTFEAFYWDQAIVAREWLQSNVANVANLFFREANGKNATIRIAMSDYLPVDKVNFAHAYLPREDLSGGDAWFNRTDFNDLVSDYDDVIIGTKAYYAFGHELAHALGLKHGHEKGGIANVAMTSERDSMEFSIMTYRSYVGAPPVSDTVGYQNEEGGFAQSLMMYDIAALQYIYGAKFSSGNNNDTNYQFSETTGEMFIDGLSQGVPKTNRIFRTIWDDGGYDRYEFGNYKTNLSVDMNPGGWIDLDVGGNSQRAMLGKNKYARAHIFNALEYNGDSRSLIEDVIGGSGNDYIKGNRINNFITGGNGNDTIHGQDGADLLLGENGRDVLYGDNGDDEIRGGASNDKLYGGNGADVVRGEGGDDQISGGHGEDMLFGGDGNDVIHGDDGDDYIQGGSGNDVLHGGNGFDIIHGGDGNDILFGGRESGELYGGPGVDTIHTGDGSYAYLGISHRGHSHYDIITGLAISVQGFVVAKFGLRPQLDDGLKGEISDGIGIKGLAFDYRNHLVSDSLFVGPGKKGDLKGSSSGIYVNTNTGLIYYNDSKDRGSHLLAKVELGIATALNFENFYYW